MNSKKANVLYALIHILFWCGYCISWSYTAVFLKSYGYDNYIVGLVTGVGAVISVIMQPLIAAVTEKSKVLNNKWDIVIIKGMSLVFMAFMMIKLPGFYTIAILFGTLTAIDASIPSLLSSVAMESNKKGADINYGLARGMGSIFYAVCSLLLGFVVDEYGTKPLAFLYIVFGALTLLVIMVFPYQKDKVTSDNAKEKNSSLGLFKKYRFLMSFLIASVLLFMGHNMVNVFLINIIENAGGSSKNLGMSLFIAAGVELPVMMSIMWLSKKIKVEKLLVISSIFFVVKSCVTLFAVNMTLVYLAQFLQFGAFALFTPASVYFIDKTMQDNDSSMGQALLGACSLGLGGTLGNVLGGYILDGAGLFVMVFSTVVLSVAGVVFMTLSYVFAKTNRY